MVLSGHRQRQLTIRGADRSPGCTSIGQECAGAHGIDAGEELEAHYRARSLLKRDVLTDDIAEAVYFLASEMSSKSTDNMINVDAGNAQVFGR
jgi:enoyl-[acyl-carrier-protein] reductase (NADH)